MKHLITLLAALTLLAATTVQAEIPPTINYQGKATDANDVPLEGEHNITFRIYEDEVGGTAKWEETHEKVDIDKGVFSVELGNGTPTPTPLNITFDKPYWISIEINRQGELEPRQPITSVGYTYRAKVADSLATSPIPSGVIVMWSGSYDSIPDGWALCNGQNGTPDLTNKFVVCTLDEYGEIPKTIVSGESKESDSNPIHTHDVGNYATSNDGAHSHSLSTQRDNINNNDDDGGCEGSTDSAGEHTHTITGTSAEATSLPPYYALAYIMKL